MNGYYWNQSSSLIEATTNPVSEVQFISKNQKSQSVQR